MESCSEASFMISHESWPMSPYPTLAGMRCFAERTSLRIYLASETHSSTPFLN